MSPVVAQQKFGKTPLLVDDEMETQYKKVYKRAMQTHDASAQINLVSPCCYPICPLPSSACPGLGLQSWLTFL